MPNNIPPVNPAAPSTPASNNAGRSRPAGVPSQTPSRSGQETQRMKAAVASLKAILDKQIRHVKEEKRLCTLVQDKAILKPNASRQEIEEKAPAVSREIANLAGPKLENIQKILALNKTRKEQLDAAIQKVKSLVGNAGNERAELRKTLGDAIREATNLGHTVTLHTALLQKRSWHVAARNQTPGDASNKNPAMSEDISKTQLDWAKRIVEMLKAIPGDHPFDFRIGGVRNARSLLWLMLESYNSQADIRIEQIVDNFDRYTVISEAWPTMGPKLFQQDETAPPEKTQDDAESRLKQCRDVVTFLDEKVFNSELYVVIHDQLGVEKKADWVEQQRKVERIETDSLALRYGNSIIRSQAHFPASIGRALTLHNELANHLIFKVTPNINLLSGLLERAQDQGLYRSPRTIVERIIARAHQKIKGETPTWKLPREIAESEEEYRLLRHLLPAYLGAADQLQLLALRVDREAKGHDKARACSSLQRLADDFRVTAKQIRTHMMELTLLGMDPEKIGESDGSKAVAEKLLELTWQQSPLIRPAPAPATNEESMSETDEQSTTTSESEQTEVPDSSVSRRAARRGEKLEQKFDELGELGRQQLKIAADCLARLREGDTSRRFSSTHVETTMQTALRYKKEQLTLLKTMKSRQTGPAGKDLDTRLSTLNGDISRLEKDTRRDVAEAISLRPTEQAIKNAIEQGMTLQVERPIVLPVTRENDFVHEYRFKIEGFRFKLHAHYQTAVTTIEQAEAPEKIHYKRFDELGTDDESGAAYYQDDRQARMVYRSKEAREGIAIARRFVEEPSWLPAALPDRARR